MHAGVMVLLMIVLVLGTTPIRPLPRRLPPDGHGAS
jgi:hypothetical protein